MSTPATARGAVDALTSDGAIVALRPVTEADATALTDLFNRASGASLRLRFFANPGRPLLAAEVARLSKPPSPRHGSIAAELGGAVVGVASYERRGTAERAAEFAVLVADEHQGRGIGTLLLEHLAQHARQQGIENLYGEVLSANARMLRVAGDLTADTSFEPGDDVVGVTFATETSEAALAAMEARDRAAGQASLRPLLAPRSVAVAGAGRRPGGVGHEVLTGMVRYGFTGPIYPVNPRATTVAGMPAYPSLTRLPGPVDLVIVATPADVVPEILDDAAAAGARAAVVLTAGFSEAGDAGRAAQLALLRRARDAGIRVVGPNCLGIINTDPRVLLDASFVPDPPPRGGLAVASQSGAVGIAVLQHISRAGCGISAFVSLGNKADVSGNDLLGYWYDDPGTSAVALYLESFGNPRKFARIARALARRKPVLAVFSGRSGAGQRAGASHTAAAAAPDVAVDTLFAQAGVVRADHLGELIDAARMLTGQPLPAGNRLAVAGNAGGANVLVADAAEAIGLELPPRVGDLDNPLDLGAGATADSLASSVSAFAASGEVDAMLVVVAATRTNDAEAMWRTVAAVTDAHPELPVAGVALGAEVSTALGQRCVPVFDLPERAVMAVGRAVRYAAWRREPLGARPELPGVDSARARERVRQALEVGEGWQPYERLEPILSAYGIPVLPSRTVHSAPRAREAADRVGYPVVLKAADPELVHKSDIGAVRLGLADGGGVEEAYGAIARAVGQPAPPVLVQPMASGTVELVAGIVHDRLFGSLVMTGLGGVQTDLLDDRAFRLVPMTDLDAGRMWRSLRSAPLLTGFRGSTGVDTGAVEDLLLRLGRLAEDLPEISELDLNPVLAGPAGVMVVDAKLRLAPVREEPDAALRRLKPVGGQGGGR